MKLSSYLDPNLIFCNIEAKTHEEAIIQILEKVAKKDSFISKQKEAIESGVLQREQEICTFYGKGISIPHCRLETFSDFYIFVGISKDGIESKTIKGDTDKINVIFLLVSGKKNNKLILNTIAAISRLSKNDELIKKLSGEKSEAKVWDLIKNADIEVTENVTAETIMRVAAIPAKPDNTLREIAVRFISEEISNLPVVDKNGKFVGAIGERELIDYGMPKYTKYFNDLSFLTGSEPFEKFFQNETIVKVEEVMNKTPITVGLKTSVMEISFLMLHNNISNLYVVENSKYLGCVTRTDIIRKVLHI